MDIPVSGRILSPRRPGMVAGEWYLRGFADAYSAHWAVVPRGPAGDEYRRGYALGLATVRREFLAAWTRQAGMRQALVWQP